MVRKFLLVVVATVGSVLMLRAIPFESLLLKESGIFFCIVLGLVLFLVMMQRRCILKPITSLMRVIEEIVNKKDYALRIPEQDNKEASAIAVSLNAVLSQLEQLDKELREVQGQAEVAQRTKSDFVSHMSHEVRMPINNIIGFAEMLDDAKLDGASRRQISLIKSSALSLLGMVTDILDFSKIEAGLLELHPKLVDFGEALQGSLAPLEAAAVQKGLTFIKYIDPRLPSTIEVDSVRLSQAVANLVNNALKFTEPPGTITVKLVVRELDATSVTLQFSVTDTGIGIPERAQKTIFEAFGQADASSTRKYNGAGLGLSITRSIVQTFGGSLWVESEVGKGSTFFISVKLAVPEQTTDTAAARSRATHREMQNGARDAQMRTFRVLVVEDNPMTQEVTVHKLKRAGFEVELAGNGIEAVQMIKRDTFDLILMDCQMPGMDGFEATRIIRELEQSWGRPHTPIIALTAHAMEGYREICLAAGMDDYLTKPIKQKELVEFVGRYLLRQAEMREHS